jgi:ribosome-binding protein aMBF1 (putative translation factor)
MDRVAAVRDGPAAQGMTPYADPTGQGRNFCVTLVPGRKDSTMARKTKIDSSYHDRRVARRREDATYRAEYDRFRRQIEQIDAVVNALDALRDEAGLSKAELARRIGKDPASIRRLFSAEVNPELKTLAAIADALDAEVVVKRRPTAKRQRRAGRREPAAA